MKQIVFDNDIVSKHPLSRYQECRSTLNDISKKDYPNSNYFDERIESIDLDYYEHLILRHQQNDNTVDAVIGIADYNDERITSERIQMVELKIGMTSVGQVKYSPFNRKINYSKNLLTGNIVVDNTIIFVFSEDFVQQARNRFAALKREGYNMAGWTAYSPTSFKEKIKFKEEIPRPYIPNYDMNSTLSLFRIIVNKDLNEAIAFLDKWIKLFYDCQSKGQQLEAQNIKEGLRAMIEDLKESRLPDANDYAEILIADNSSIFGE